MPSRAARIAACLLSVSALFSGVVLAEDLQPFEVSYSWIWGGVTVALSTLTLAHRDDDKWTYSSANEPRGLGKLYPMRPKMQSTMRITDQNVQPLSFLATGGGAAHDADVSFDWDAGRATGVYEDAKVDLPLKPGIQDDLSVQIAMLVQMLHGKTPENLSMIDKNTVREYQYRREGQETITTPLGRIDAIIYSSQHPGSPRITRYWCAPSKGYLPMRVEQKRLDSVEWTLEIQSLKH